MSTQSNLNLKSKDSGPVECLGQTFPSDDARREHYLSLLAKKLKDPEFRKIEGFPIGEDEDFLALSDPPYYTACPNPWIGDFIKHYGQPYDPKEKYHREPFAADMSEGKSDPVYQLHGYHTKVPHKAIIPCILHYSKPGDIVLDAFSGTGMTGVASQFCAHPVTSDLDKVVQSLKASSGKSPLWGKRLVVLSDLSPIAAFLSYNLNTPADLDLFTSCYNSIFQALESKLGWMFQTTHKETEVGRIEFTVWNEVFACPSCLTSHPFSGYRSQDEDHLTCPSCGSQSNKRSLTRIMSKHFDNLLGRTIQTSKRVPVTICYQYKGKTYNKTPDKSDLENLDKIERMGFPDKFPHFRMMNAAEDVENWGDKWRAGTAAFTHVHHIFLTRTAHVLDFLWKEAAAIKDRRSRNLMLFLFEQAVWTSSILNRYQPQGFKQVNKYLPGVYYIPSVNCEVSPWYAIGARGKRLAKTLETIPLGHNRSIISTSSATSLNMPDSSVDYVFTDPPFGENLAYSELNFVLEAFHRVFTNQKTEAIISGAQQKRLNEYQNLMRRSFAEYYRVLKPGRWMTVVFSNTRAAVWNGIQTAMQEVGFVVANVAALDKQLGSFNAVTTPTAVKQDLVITAYKPNGGLVDRFSKGGQGSEGVWDFIRTHLSNLPIVKARGGEMEFITERDPRILHDRMIAFYIGQGMPVPLSSAEFQAALADKFPEREGMFFLPEQVTEWDRKRAQMQGVGQMSIFVEDERSAIDWLRGFLRTRPSVIGDIAHEFMQQLGASWKKFETRPELGLLLEQNFLRYEGKDDVPSQIHSYLSTQNKDLRNLSKDDARLQARAKDRWYVPDPAKAVDVEAIRNKRLLQEFWNLCTEVGIARPSGPSAQQTLPLPLPTTAKKTGRKKLKEVRTEAVRLGFKECFAAKDYTTILAIAEHLPANVIEEDEQLQMMHDMAEMRAQG
jgi:DNA modification methylase